MRAIKDKDGNLLFEPVRILERWAEYVEELYNDTRDMCNDEQVTQEICVISEMEVAAIIQS